MKTDELWDKGEGTQLEALWTMRLTTLLDLTTAQQTQATAVFLAEETTLASLTTPMQTAQTALQTAVVKNDKAGITTAAGTIGTLTTQQVTADATADAAFYLILTATQQTKYTALQLPGLGASGAPDHGGRNIGVRPMEMILLLMNCNNYSVLLNKFLKLFISP